MDLKRIDVKRAFERACVRWVVCLSIAVCGLGASAAAHSSGLWAPTATGVLSALPHKGLAPLPATRRLQVVLTLKMRNQAALDQHIARMFQPGDMLYGTHLSATQFAAAGFLPTPQQVAAVKSYLISTGFDDIQVAPNRLLITAEAPVPVIEAAFNTRLRSFLLKGKQRFANTLSAQVPGTLQGIVSSVLGLQNMVRAHTMVRTLAAPGQKALPVPEFAVAYDASVLPTASNTTVAIFMSGDLTQVSKDFRQAISQNHLPNVPVDIVQIGTASTDTSANDEWDLDSQSSLGMAGNFRRVIWYNAASLGNADLLRAFNRWVSDDQAKVASASFGECEGDASQGGFIKSLDPILKEAVAQGQTLFVSSGDTGGSGCPVVTVPILGLPVGVPAVTYPASSPYAVGVGGTTLTTDADYGYTSESVWKGGGGGISTHEPAPVWQQPVLPQQSGSGGPHRGVPDVAMDADPNTGAQVIVSGQTKQVGGTSLSAPLAMGAWARMETVHGNRLGFADPLFYAQASGPGQPAAGFHDIVSGNNGSYSASAGYDYASGLGSFDVAALSPLLGQAASSPPPGSSSGAGTPPPSSGSSGGSGTSSSSASGGSVAPGLLLLLGLMAAGRRYYSAKTRR